MSSFSMTEASEILKRDYLPVVREQIPSKTPLFSRIQKGTEDVVGSEARLSLRINRNQGVGARANGAALPTAGSNKYKQIGIDTKNIYGRVSIDGKIFKAAANNTGAFLTVTEAELKGLVEGLQWDLNRMLFNQNVGKLATLAVATTTTTLTATASNASYITRWLQKDMYIDIYNSDDSTVATGRQITGVNKTAGTFTISGANVSVTVGGYVTREGARNNEITGLMDILTASNTLYGIDRSLAANAYFNPQVLANGGSNRTVSEVLLQQALDEGEINAGASASLMISTHGTRRAYQNLLIALKRFTEPRKLQGGWTALDYNGLDWVVDPDMKTNTVYILDESTLKIHTMIPEIFEWGEEDGLVLRQISGFDAYEAFMVGYMEMVCDTPAKNTVLKDITEA